MSKPRRLRTILAVGALVNAAHVPSAGAQDLLPEKSVSVRERPRPEYDSIGIDWMGLRAYPELTVDVRYDDNVFATETDTVGDRLTETIGRISLRSDSTRVPFSVYGAASSRSYSDLGTESYDEWRAGGSVSYPLARRTSVSFTGERSRDHQSRGDSSFPSGAVEPPRIETSNATLGIRHAFASGNLQLNVQRESLNFFDAELVTGNAFDQDFRDRELWTLDVRGDIAVGPSTGVFVQAVHAVRDHRLDAEAAGIDRDAVTDAVLVGAAWHVSDLMRGEIGVGVLDLRHEAEGLGDRRSVAATSRIEWYASQLMTATFEYQRTSAAADIAESASYVGSTASLRIDYELRRNVLLSARTARGRRDYTGLDAVERTRSAAIGAEWLLNRHLRVGVDYTIADYDRPLPAFGETYARDTIAATVDFAW